MKEDKQKVVFRLLSFGSQLEDSVGIPMYLWLITCVIDRNNYAQWSRQWYVVDSVTFYVCSGKVSELTFTLIVRDVNILYNAR